MYIFRSPKFSRYLDIVLISVLYALIFTSLIYFVDPIEEKRSVTDLLGNTFIFGAIAGFFTGLIGGLWVNRIDRINPIPIGITTGLICTTLGSFIFPFFGGLVNILYLGEPATNYLLDVSLLLNLSIISFAPAVFIGLITGGIGALLSGEIGSAE